MHEKDPSNIPLITYAWVIGLSIMGGVVNFIRKLQTGHARVFNLLEFIGEIVTAGFTGVITFYLFTNANVDPLMTAAAVGISGHMGSRALMLFESWLTRQFPPIK
jgi:hypothetical protein